MQRRKPMKLFANDAAGGAAQQSRTATIAPPPAKRGRRRASAHLDSLKAEPEAKGVTKWLMQQTPR